MHGQGWSLHELPFIDFLVRQAEKDPWLLELRCRLPPIGTKTTELFGIGWWKPMQNEECYLRYITSIMLTYLL